MTLHCEESIGQKDLEDRLLNIVSQLLPRGKTISIHDNFFECGGDSMMVIDLICEAKAQGLKLSMKQVTDHPTVFDLTRSYNESQSTLLIANRDVENALPLLPNQSFYAFTKSMTVLIYLLNPVFKLKKDKLEGALQLMVQRHEALRLRFIEKDSQWQQVIEPYTVSVIVDHVYLASSLSPEQREQHIKDYYQKLLVSIDVESQQGAIRSALFEWENEQLFFFAIDHYSFDEVSMKLFWHELYLAYLEKELVPITSSYSVIVDNLYKMTKKWDIQQEQQFWLQQLSSVEHLPKKIQDCSSVSQGIKGKVYSLHSEHWINKLITVILARTGIQVHDILLTAWIQTLTMWGNLKGVVIILGSHNRELMDEMMHTMGCFVTSYPLYFTKPSTKNVRVAINGVRNRLKQIPHKGMRYMLSMMSDKKWQQTVFGLPQPSLGFNYLGDEELNKEMWLGKGKSVIIGDMVSVSNGELLSGRHQATCPVPYLILHCQVNTNSQTITFTCDYDSGHYTEVEIDELMQLYLQNIKICVSELDGK